MAEVETNPKLEKTLGFGALPVDLVTWFHDWREYKEKTPGTPDQVVAETQLGVDGSKILLDLKDFVAYATGNGEALKKIPGKVNFGFNITALGADVTDGYIKYNALQANFNFSDFVGLCADIVDGCGIAAVYLPGLEEFSIPLKVAAWILAGTSIATANWGGSKEEGTASEKAACWRRFKIEPPCRSKFEPGLDAVRRTVVCG